jgi:hypothetical protein
MWLRRDDSGRAPVVPAAGEASSVWDGLPRVPAAPLVIRAERAGDRPESPPRQAA